jgi:2-amino-4-hydroxy-6-hydroxymethyldihydropteridine diphosphokinase
VSASAESERAPGGISGPDHAVRTTSSEEWVVVALGSNLGDSAGLLRQAIERLETLSGGGLRRSSCWRTTPLECPPGSADFLNAVVAWKRREGQTPEALLESLQCLEREFGRRPKVVLNEPRPLDLDLIACGQELRNSDRLTLPHPRAVERAFVLFPLAEILPELRLPGQTRSVRVLRDALGEADRLLVERVDAGGQE